MENVFILAMKITNKIDEANFLIKKFSWIDFFIVSLDENKMVIFGTMDSSFGKQVEIIMENVCYIDMPTSWKMNIKENNPIKFISQNNMTEAFVNKFLDNGKGDLFMFSAESFMGETFYHIAASSFELRILSYNKYFPWNMDIKN